jgi:hypothetical protein
MNEKLSRIKYISNSFFWIAEIITIHDLFRFEELALEYRFLVFWNNLGKNWNKVRSRRKGNKQYNKTFSVLNKKLHYFSRTATKILLFYWNMFDEHTYFHIKMLQLSDPPCLTNESENHSNEFETDYLEEQNLGSSQHNLPICWFLSFQYYFGLMNIIYDYYSIILNRWR